MATETVPATVANNITQQINELTLTEGGQGQIEVKGEGGDATNAQNETASYASKDNNEELYWGFSLHEAYKMAIKFYKDNEGKRTFDLSYEDKVSFAALTKQVTLGPYAEQTQLPEIGYLDMFGNDRRRIWESLEDLSSNDARRNFIKQLQIVAPVFVPFMTAHQKQKEEEERKRLEEEKRRQEEEERQRRELEEQQKREAEVREEERMRQEQENIQIEQKRQIMAALNEQTAQQFQQYAAQQFPGNPEQQTVLIAQLQEQHYQQYMELYQKQQQQQTTQSQGSPAAAVGSQPDQHQFNPDAEDENSDGSDVSEESQPRIAEPSMWNRPQIDEFKEQIKRDPESVLTVGRGEVITVRVPTHEEGSYVFWEFATDYYDLGFGVYFEWSDSPAQQVSVHVNESSEEEGSGDEEEVGAVGGDVEVGSDAKSRPLTDEIVPVFRRECQTEGAKSRAQSCMTVTDLPSVCVRIRNSVMRDSMKNGTQSFMTATV